MKKILLYSFLLLIGIAIGFRVWLAIQGITVTSWYRSPWKNKEVGGKSNSVHLIGWGFDIVPVNPDMMKKLAQWFGTVYKEKDHIHVQII